MKASVIYVGLDVHKDSIVISVAREGREAAENWKTIPNDATRLRKALQMLIKHGEVLKVCYEAGPTGFGLCRRLREAGIDCLVVAPSLVPGKPGDRVKTDRRDARKLAHFLRSGDLTEVYVPDESVEALRDLERARDDAKCAERVARHQLSKFLLRHDRRWEGSTWTQKHRDWIRTQTFAYPAQQGVLEDYLKTVEDLAERVDRLTAELEKLVQDTTLAPLVQALQAFRGISLVSAVTIAAEAADLRRFQSASQFMSYVGLVPSEDSTGTRRRQGPITRCGNGHLRRILALSASTADEQGAATAQSRTGAGSPADCLGGAEAVAPTAVSLDEPRQEPTEVDRRPGSRIGGIRLGRRARERLAGGRMSRRWGSIRGRSFARLVRATRGTRPLPLDPLPSSLCSV
jgi:transposase